MKRIKYFATIALFAGLTLMSMETIAQRGPGRGMGMMNNPNQGFRMGECILDLSEEQQSQIDVLRTNHLKEITPLRNEMGEKQARLRTLQSADKPDLAAINKVIDDISTLRADIQKKGVAHRAEVSKLLTEEQRAVFNARKSNRMGMKGQGANRGGMRGMGGMGYCSNW